MVKGRKSSGMKIVSQIIGGEGSGKSNAHKLREEEQFLSQQEMRKFRYGPGDECSYGDHFFLIPKIEKRIE